jgi:hypothetical protein
MLSRDAEMRFRIRRKTAIGFGPDDPKGEVFRRSPERGYAENVLRKEGGLSKDEVMGESIMC